MNSIVEFFKKLYLANNVLFEFDGKSYVTKNIHFWVSYFKKIKKKYFHMRSLILSPLFIAENQS